MNNRKNPNHLKKSASFTKIYNAAKSRNAKILEEYGQSGTAFIDVKNGFEFGLITPAGLLQMEGDTDAANFLITHHADIDYAGYGAALGNNEEQAEFWRKYHGASAEIIARGAAYAGNFSYANRLRQHHGASTATIIMGCIMGNHLDHANAYLKEIKKFSTEEWANIGKAIGILGGSIPQNLLLELPPHSSHEVKVNMIRGAGIAGHFNFKPDPSYNMPYLEQGIIQGGHFDYFDKKAPDITNNAFEYALLGCHLHFVGRYYNDNMESYAHDKIKVENYRAAHQSNCIQLASWVRDKNHWIARLFQDRGMTSLAGCDLRMLSFLYNKSSHINSLLDQISLAEIFPNEALALHALTFLDNQEFHDKLLDIATKSYKDQLTKLPYNILIILSDAKKLRVLMKKYSLNYDQAYTLLRCDDVRNIVLNVAKDFSRTDVALSLDVCAIITMRLSSLSFSDAKELFQKIRHYRFDLQEIINITGELNCYSQSSGARHSERAISLSGAISQFTTREEIIAALKQQIDLFNETEQQAIANQSSWMVVRAAGTTTSVISKATRNTVGLFANASTPKHETPPDNYDTSEKFYALVSDNYLRLK